MVTSIDKGDPDPEQKLLPLFNSTQKWDEESFNKVYNVHARRLFSFVYTKLKHREATEEIVQEIFVSLWCDRERLKIHTSIEAYLVGAAKNKILSYIRSEKVRRRYAAELTRFAEENCDTTFSDQSNCNDLLVNIQLIMAELPERCQLAFNLSRMVHTPIPQIAEKMNISRRTVENYISVALRHLRGRLGELLVLILASIL
jgi:RNA polymerase sigma-70 factor (family 1)